MSFNDQASIVLVPRQCNLILASTLRTTANKERKGAEGSERICQGMTRCRVCQVAK